MNMGTVWANLREVLAKKDLAIENHGFKDERHTHTYISLRIQRWIYLLSFGYVASQADRLIYIDPTTKNSYICRRGFSDNLWVEFGILPQA
jgi:hypothetical protein